MGPVADGNVFQIASSRTPSILMLGDSTLVKVICSKRFWFPALAALASGANTNAMKNSDVSPIQRVMLEFNLSFVSVTLSGVVRC